MDKYNVLGLEVELVEVHQDSNIHIQDTAKDRHLHSNWFWSHQLLIPNQQTKSHEIFIQWMRMKRKFLPQLTSRAIQMICKIVFMLLNCLRQKRN